MTTARQETLVRSTAWQRWWARRLVAALERRLQRECCTHDGRTTCWLCRFATGMGCPPGAAGGVR